MKLSLGIDIGSSSIKLSLLDIAKGECIGSCTYPSQEMEIIALKSGWAEQDPDMWWDYICQGLEKLSTEYELNNIRSIGITYQMHGLVCLDKEGSALRNSIIWCDSRAVEIGANAFKKIGKERCLKSLLNSPGNFTASKLAWVKENEPELFAKIDKFCLPGDYIAFKLTGDICTTISGLSEQILWDFSENTPADFVRENYGIPSSYMPKHKMSLEEQSRTSKQIAERFGIPEGTPISYRAGDQPNNAFSLNVMDPGEVAATAGTSGVVYGVTNVPKADSLSRVNTFLHVNHSSRDPRYGILLCINGTGILNAWIKRNVAESLSYEQMNQEIKDIAPGSEGLVILPFGNGAERILENKYTGVEMYGLDLNRHSQAHLLRAAQEGIAFSFRYGIDIMRQMGLEPRTIKAGKANMFLSPVFRETLATLCDASIELYNTDGALGAARGAAWGAGLYSSRQECFSGLSLLEKVSPILEWKQPLEEAYQLWKDRLEISLKKIN